MGCLCAKPVLPPPEYAGLVGTWCNNATAAKMNVGYGRYRHTRGYIPGISSGDEELCVRLKVDTAGCISYAHVPARARGPLTLIDMPVTDWGADGTLALTCGAPPLTITGDASTDTIVVAGVELTRQRGKTNDL